MGMGIYMLKGKGGKMGEAGHVCVSLEKGERGVSQPGRVVDEGRKDSRGNCGRTWVWVCWAWDLEYGEWAWLALGWAGLGWLVGLGWVGVTSYMITPPFVAWDWYIHNERKGTPPLFQVSCAFYPSRVNPVILVGGQDGWDEQGLSRLTLQE